MRSMAFKNLVKKLMGCVLAGIIATTLVIGISGSANAGVSSETPVQMVLRQLVDYHITEGRLRYGHKIDLEFVEEDMVNAFAYYDGEKAGLGVDMMLLKIMTPDEALIVLCHELGHALGDMAHSKFPNDPKHREDNPLSLEGEADYFAGKCAVDYYVNFEGLDYSAAQEKAFFSAHSMFGTLYETDGINAEKAKSARFNGVNYEYPDPNCRTLSVWAGAEGLPRPKCWYNP